MNDEQLHSGNKIAFNTLVQIIGRVFTLALSLISIKIITNYLGPQGTGLYNTILTYYGFAIVIADFGLFTVAVREISKNPESQKNLLSNIFTIRLFASVIITTIALSIAFIANYPPELKYGLLLCALFPALNLISSVYDILFQYRLEMHKVALSEIISKVLTVTLLYSFAKYNLGYYSIVSTIIFATLVSFIVKISYAKKHLPFRFSFSRSEINSIIKMSIPFGVVFIVNNIYFKIDSLMLFYFKGAVAVGIYSVAFRVLEITLFTGAYFSSSLKPFLSTSVENDPKKAALAISKGSTFLTAIALLITMLGVTFPKEVILFLSNQNFLGGTTALFVLSFVPIFIFIGGLMGEIMVAKDMRRILLRNSGLIVLINILLNLVIIPRYSYNGAAFTTLASEIILFVISYLSVYKTFSIQFDLKKIARLFGFASLCVLIGFFFKTLQFHFLINYLCITALYLTAIYYTDSIPKENIDRFLNFLIRKASRIEN